MNDHRLRVKIAGLFAVLAPACGPERAATGAADAGGDPGTGFLFAFDAGIQSCPEAGAPAPDASDHDAAACQPSRQVSYMDDVVPIFHGSCNGEVCHNGSWGNTGAYLYLVGVRAPECCDGRKLVRPGDPGGSYLIQKLRGVHLCAGQPMPLDRTLDERDVATLSDWICEGAPHP